MLQAMTVQVVDWCDMVSNVRFISSWKDISRPKQEIIKENNQNENRNHKPHSYIVRDKILVSNNKENKYE